MSNQLQRKSEPNRSRKSRPKVSDHDDVHKAESNAGFTLPAATIMRLQRTIGNQAVMRLMSKTNTTPATTDSQRTKKFTEDVEVDGILSATGGVSSPHIGGQMIFGGVGHFYEGLHSPKFIEEGSADTQGEAGKPAESTPGPAETPAPTSEPSEGATSDPWDSV